MPVLPLLLLQWCYDCSPAVAEATKATLNRLVQLGAQQVEIALPELELAQVCNSQQPCFVTVVSELARVCRLNFAKQPPCVLPGWVLGGVGSRPAAALRTQ